MTSSPRLSYFGLQMALAFYLINLQEFKIQTSLERSEEHTSELPDNASLSVLA